MYVREEESKEIDETIDPQHASFEGLGKAISFFVIAAAARAILEPSARLSPQTFLCHTSAKTSDHTKLDQIIAGTLPRMGDHISGKLHDGRIRNWLDWARAELGKTVPSMPSVDAIAGWLKDRINVAPIHIKNSKTSEIEFRRGLNFLVGGNILGRGLTIENLLVTYYLRRARVSQMDTVLQHARMFGYRSSLMPYTRVFLTRELAARFNAIHTAETKLRAFERPARTLVEYP